MLLRAQKVAAGELLQKMHRKHGDVTRVGLSKHAAWDSTFWPNFLHVWHFLEWALFMKRAIVIIWDAIRVPTPTASYAVAWLIFSFSSKLCRALGGLSTNAGLLTGPTLHFSRWRGVSILFFLSGKSRNYRNYLFFHIKCPICEPFSVAFLHVWEVLGKKNRFVQLTSKWWFACPHQVSLVYFSIYLHAAFDDLSHHAVDTHKPFWPLTTRLMI